MVDADPMTIAVVPDEASFKSRLQRSGRLDQGWLDLAIDLDGESIGRIQTFVPSGRPLPPNVFEVGIGLREDARAERVEAPTDPANVPMRTVFERSGWELVGTLNEFDRDWVMYAISRPVWDTRSISRDAVT